MARRPRAHPGATNATVGDGDKPVVGGSIIDDAINPAELGTGGGGFDPDPSGTDGDSGTGSTGGPKLNRDGTPRKKRGPKTGAGKTRVHDLKASIDSLTSMLGVLHAGIGLATSTPEMVLTEDEARELATAAVPVLDQFDWMPDPRYAAIGGLLIVAGKIYIPRVGLVVARKRSEGASKPRPVSPTQPMSNVSPINSGFSNFGEPTVN